MLGGSFNPAHSGHLHISHLAIQALGLDEIWWLVSPQNPLKPVMGMAPFPERLNRARMVARDPRIRVSDIETKLGTRFTIDTVKALKQRFPETEFVWIAGADIMVQIHRWKNWTRLFHMVPIAIFDRPRYSFPALSSVAAHRFRAGRAKRSQVVSQKSGTNRPVWVFFRVPLNPVSASEIRRKRENAKRLAEHGVVRRGRVRLT